MKMHMRRHYWAVERMWESLLARLHERMFQSSSRGVGRGSAPRLARPRPRESRRVSLETCIRGPRPRLRPLPSKGRSGEEEYVPQAGRGRVEDEPTTRGDKPRCSVVMLSACNQCHRMLEVQPEADRTTSAGRPVAVSAFARARFRRRLLRARSRSCCLAGCASGRVRGAHREPRCRAGARVRARDQGRASDRKRGTNLWLDDATGGHIPS